MVNGWNRKGNIMKTRILALLAMLTSTTAIAVDSNDKSEEQNESKYDHKKYCYYADKEYSKGSILKQVDELKVCKRSKNGTLVWVSR